MSLQISTDAAKRNYLLEKKIAELLAQLGRVTKTARFVADAGSGSPTVNRDLIQCSEQVDLIEHLILIKTMLKHAYIIYFF